MNCKKNYLKNIKEEKKNKHEEEYQEWLNTKYPTTEEELDFLFT